MLKQASVSDLITDRVGRGKKTYVVTAMRRYPRFINRELFEDWLSTKRRTGDRNGAFPRVDFERRFTTAVYEAAKQSRAYDAQAAAEICENFFGYVTEASPVASFEFGPSGKVLLKLK